MQVEIYADIVFVINLIMDFFILFVTSKVLRKKTKTYRLWAGAAISAALYCAMVFFAVFSVWLSVISSILIISLGILVGFCPMTKKEFLKFLLSSHAVAFAVGGCGIAIFYYTDIPNAVGNAVNATTRNFSVKILIIAVCVSYIGTKLVTGLLRKLAMQKRAFFQFDLWLGGKNVRLNGLVDTGNSLVEPISNKGVIVAEHCAIKDILPENVYAMFENKLEDNLQTVLDVFSNGILQNRLRFIPFTSLGRKNGVLIGFRADKADIVYDRGTETINDVIIGICGFKLSAGGDYRALINPSLINR